MKIKSVVKQFNVYYQFLQFEKQFLMLKAYDALNKKQKKGDNNELEK